jgi:lipopolysaccharide/colanic/teichoic acid biosynthesis glycosyltransferase
VQFHGRELSLLFSKLRCVNTVPVGVLLLKSAMPRIVEVTLALAGLLVLSPILLIIGLLVKLQDGGTVFYKATRVGLGGKPFVLYKFRTMVPGAEKIGAAITTSGDTRITPLGRFLRRYKLDELPQLVNVIAGDLSFVGARPEDPRYVTLYNLQQREILDFRPGITSPASLRYRDEEKLLDGADWHTRYVHEILPQKLAMDLAYLKRKTITSDIRIILKTLGGILQ